MEINGVSGVSQAQASVWNTIIERLFDVTQDTGVSADTPQDNRLERLSKLVQGTQTLSLRTMLTDLAVLDKADELEKEALMTLIAALLSRLQSGAVSQTLLNALGALLGELGEIAPELLEDLIPDIKHALKRVIRDILTQLLKNPDSTQALSLLGSVTKLLRQLGIEPRVFIQSIARTMGIDAEKIEAIMASMITGETNPDLTSLILGPGGLSLDGETLLPPEWLQFNALNTASRQKLESELGGLLDSIANIP
mgnify:CR=1 FL=1